MIEETAPDAPPVRVVMLVINDVTSDSRVKREALALAEAGADVIVLGAVAEGPRTVEKLGAVLVVRVPVSLRLQEERSRRRDVRRGRRPPLVGYREDRIRVARALRARARVIDLDAAHHRLMAKGRRGAVAQAGFRLSRMSLRARAFRWKVARKLVWLRAGIGTRVNAPFEFGWRGWRWVGSRITWPPMWRSAIPEAFDYEFAFGKIIDQLKPDVIHAHDMHLIGVAARAAGRALGRDRDVKIVYDAHEYVAGIARYGKRTPRFVAAWAAHEREYIGAADRVITVSPELAERLHERYELPRMPVVVLNTPMLSKQAVQGASIRHRVGLPESTPLVVYSGGLTPARGVELVIEAMTRLPDAHLAIICVPGTEVPYARVLQEYAHRCGVGRRVHFVDPVRADEVVDFLSTGDVGVDPLVAGVGSHEVALPNKLFAYLYAELPVVVSDLPSLGRFVRQWRVGETFRPGDPVDLAGRIAKVLAGRQRYVAATANPELRQAISAERQSAVLRELYVDLVKRPLGGQGTRSLLPVGVTSAARAGLRARMVIGPANSAGQGWAWARAVERELPNVGAEALMIDAGVYDFPCDILVSQEEFRDDYDWITSFARHVLENTTHVLFEAGRPILGQPRGGYFVRDLPSLASAGIVAGLVLHGSEIRDPRRHRELYRNSPFTDPDERTTEHLQRRSDVLRGVIADVGVARFVSTPDLIDFIDDAVWLPLVVDVNDLASDAPVFERPRPVVVHAPSNSVLKGSAVIDPVLDALHQGGVIEYRRLRGVAHRDLVDVIRNADIVVDQLMLGSYGVLACEAMAAGRLTIGHVVEHVRTRIPGPLPIVEAGSQDLEAVIRRAIADRDISVKTAAAGVEYARSMHDGHEAAKTLASFLGVGEGTLAHAAASKAGGPAPWREGGRS